MLNLLILYCTLCTRLYNNNNNNNNNKISEISLKCNCVSFSDSYQRLTRVSHRNMASGQLSRIHQKRSVEWPPNSPDPWTSMSTMSGMRCWRTISQAPSKSQVNHRTQRSVRGDLRLPATGTDQQSFSLRLKRCACKSWR